MTPRSVAQSSGVALTIEPYGITGTTDDRGMATLPLAATARTAARMAKEAVHEVGHLFGLYGFMALLVQGGDNLVAISLAPECLHRSHRFC